MNNKKCLVREDGLLLYNPYKGNNGPWLPITVLDDKIMDIIDQIDRSIALDSMRSKNKTSKGHV